MMNHKAMNHKAICAALLISMTSAIVALGQAPAAPAGRGALPAGRHAPRHRRAPNGESAP